MTSTDTYAYKLYLSDFMRGSVIRMAIHALQLPPGSSGLDAGSHTVLLAETVMPDGHVTGLDVSQEFLAYAKKNVEKAVLSGQVSFREGNINNLPFDDDSFDWIWSADCAGYAPGDTLSQLKEFARVVKPGGKVAILGWSSQQLLPGHPVLEARLNATAQGVAPFVKGKKPELHFLRTLGWLKIAGLEEPMAHTFAGDIQAPLSDDIRNAMILLFEMRWGGAEAELSQEDRAEFQRLCHTGSPDFVLNLPDYYAFFTYTLFHGRVAG